jgi:hypothetical protein
MLTIAHPGQSDVDVVNLQDHLYRVRHLGRTETLILRDSDAMRIGMRVGLQTVCASALGIVSTVPLNFGEHLKISLSNEIQRFHTELRGVVRRIELAEDGRYLMGIELFSRLMPLDVMMLRRIGFDDSTYSGKVWV